MEENQNEANMKKLTFHNIQPGTDIVISNEHTEQSQLEHDKHEDHSGSMTVSASRPRSRSTIKERNVLGRDKTIHRYKIWLRGELIGLGIVIVVVWGLLIAPIIVFHVPLPLVS